MTDTAYVFDGTRHEAELKRLRTLEAVFDPGTRACLLATGLRAGWRCLEVGAGAGSVATWLCEAAGPPGRVSERVASWVIHVERSPEAVRSAAPVTHWDPSADWSSTRVTRPEGPRVSPSPGISRYSARALKRRASSACWFDSFMAILVEPRRGLSQARAG